MVEESASSVPVPLLSLTSKICAEHYWLHPFRIADSAPQTSAQVESHLQAAVEAIEVFAQGHPLPARPTAMTKVRKQLPELAALVDFWWAGVRRDLAHAAISPLWRQWAERVLAPAGLLGAPSGSHTLYPQESQCGKHWRLCKSPLTSMRSPNAFLPRPSKSGKHGRPTG